MNTYALGFQHGLMRAPQVLGGKAYKRGWRRGREHRDRIIGSDALAGRKTREPFPWPQIRHDCSR